MSDSITTGVSSIICGGSLKKHRRKTKKHRRKTKKHRRKSKKHRRKTKK